MALQPLSEFCALVESELRRLDAMTGRPAERRALGLALEAAGMTSGELRTVIAWFERQTNLEGSGRLVEVLGSEDSWRDVVDIEAERRKRIGDDAPPEVAGHYPGMPERSYETNPLIRELHRRPPFTDADAVDAYRAGFGGNLLYLAMHLGWSDPDEFREHRVTGKEPAGVKRLRKALGAAGIKVDPWSWIPKGPRKTAAERAADERKEERHKKALALFRTHAGLARKGDAELIAGWDPQSEVEA